MVCETLLHIKWCSQWGLIQGLSIFKPFAHWLETFPELLWMPLYSLLISSKNVIVCL